VGVIQGVSGPERQEEAKMMQRLGPGKGKEIFIIVISSLALVLGSALMLAIIRDHRVQTRASHVDHASPKGASAAGKVYEQDNGPIGSGSDAGYIDTAGEGLRCSMDDVTAVVRFPEADIALDPDSPHEPAQGIAADGAGLAVSYEPSVLPVALGGGEGVTQGGQGTESGEDHAGSDANREIWEAEEQKTEQELETAEESQNKLAEILKEMAEIHAGIIETVFTPR